MKLMIVDDHAEIRALIRDLIGGFATEIVECTNGVEAAYRCAAFHPDVVTMDLNLPLLSGFEATRRIVAAEPTARVIVISQFDDAEFRLAASHAGASRFFSKSNLAELPHYVEQQTHAPFESPRLMSNESPEVESQSSTPHGQGEHILLVDDEPGVVDSLCRTLEDLGYQVTTALSANGALQLIRSRSEIFDCILTDFNMPGMTGITLARECRAWLPHTPIILMTGRGGEMTPDRLRSNGISELILKPFTSQLIAQALQRALAGKKRGGGLN